MFFWARRMQLWNATLPQIVGQKAETFSFNV